MTGVSRAEIARRLWNEHLKVEYYSLADLARDEWLPEKATHSLPRYYPDGERVVGEPQGEFFEDATYKTQGARDEHYAVRTYIYDTATMGCQLIDGKFPDEAVFGEVESDGVLPQGIPLVGRIMGALGYRRGVNNLGQTYFNLNSATGDAAKNMFADAIHFDPPIDAPELPKQFVSQIHIQDLRGTHPKLADYIEAMMRAAPDPLQGLEDVMRKLDAGEKVSEAEAEKFLQAAARSIKERPWKIPLENALDEGWDEVRWDAEVAKLEAALAGHDASPTEASQYAVWTIFNGLRVNHQAFLTGNIWDTMLCHIISGRKVIDPAGTEKSLVTEHAGGVELGGLIQAAVAAIPRDFAFQGPVGRSFTYQGEGPFVEYIERTMVRGEGGWQRVNDAFLPSNAKQVFQSTMPKTRAAQSWAEEMLAKLRSEPQELLRECEAKGWLKAAAKLRERI